MRALIFADRLGSELAPLTEETSVPLLPIAGKELLVYTIEDLVSAGVRDLVVVAGAHGEQTGVSTLGGGQRWGAEIRYVLSAGEESPAAVWARLNLRGAEAVLALRGDVLRSPTIGAFLGEAQNKAGTFAFSAGGEDPCGGVFLLRPGCREPGDLLERLRWPGPESKALPTEGRCELPSGSFSRLEDLRAFHRANLDVVSGRFAGLAVAGRTVALGLHAGRRASVSARSLKGGVAYIGANSRVHPDAELLGDVVVCHDVVVDRAATIRDSVILPRTYVGELVEIGDAIVANNQLIRVDTGAILKITDAFLLGSLGAAGGRARTSGWDRLAGLLLLVVSLPLWPLAAAAAALSGAGTLMAGRELVGNRNGSPVGDTGGRIFVARHWNTGIPVLRHLPRLLAVAGGDLRLVGVSPLTPEQSAARSEDWQMVRDRAPVGLLGPTQLNLGADAPLEERLLSDAFYAREHGRGKDLGYLLGGLRMLFSKRAWRRVQRHDISEGMG
jgi:NDP-sugar pyrophosphorylase family protein